MIHMLNKNLQFFKKNSNILYETLINSAPLINVNLTKLDNQLNYVIENNNGRCFVHSPYDIENEIHMTFRNVTKDTEVIIIFGLGCGYYLDYIKKNYRDIKKLIIIEPTLQIFKELMKDIDIYDCLRGIKAVHLILNDDAKNAAEAVIHEIKKNQKVSLVFNISYCTIFNEYYKRFTKIMTERLKNARNNVVTNASSKTPWLINSIKNLRQDFIEIEHIAKIFKDRPIIIVSAGPSLNKNMHLLNDVKDKAIVLAVGSGIRVLDMHGIIPHFRMAMDGLPRQNKTFEKINMEYVPLIYCNQLYYEILPNYKGKKIQLLTAADYIGKYIFDDVELLADTGASVANSAVSLACKLGCSKVIFVGQDLAYTGGEIKAKGAAIFRGHDLKTNPDKYIKAKDVFGNDVYTENSYLTMKYGIESIIKRYKNIDFIDATEGGLYIEGTVVKSLKDVIEQDLNNSYKLDIENEFKKLTESNLNINQRKYKVEKAFNKMSDEIDQIIQIDEEIFTTLKDASNILNQEKNVFKARKLLQGLNAKVDELNKIPFYNKVVANALDTIFVSIITSFAYKGSDEIEEIESILKISFNRLVETHKYVMLAAKLISQEL